MDRVVETPNGFDCIVDGRRFGTWRSKGEARAGMQVEQRRATERADAESERRMQQVDDTNREFHEHAMNRISEYSYLT